MSEYEYLRMMIERITRQHQEAIQPYLDRLAAIYALRPPQPILREKGDVPVWMMEQLTSKDPC